MWLQNQQNLGKANNKPGAVCVALSIPQGGGKTSLSSCMEVVLRDQFNINTATISYDDFYLTYDD